MAVPVYLNVAAGRQLDSETGPSLELESHIVDTGDHQHRHPREVQVVVLIALGLPVLFVEVRQLQQRRRRSHKSGALGIERGKRVDR